jgi:hypothetical protein
MSLQDLGNLGEFIGAIGVVVSLIYLAAQIRHNTRAIRASAQQETTRDVSDFLSQITDNAEVARILRIGLGEWDKLDDDDRMRFSMLLSRPESRTPSRSRVLGESVGGRALVHAAARSSPLVVHREVAPQ